MSTHTAKPASSADFWNLLSRSRLFDASRLADLKAEFEASTQAADAAAAAEWLGARKLITAWQKKRLLRGQPGPFFLGDYRLLEPLKTDRPANLLRALHVPSGKGVVIALLDRNRCNDVEAWTGIVRRTALAHQAANPMLSRTWALEQADGNRFIVCEDVRGQTLRQELSKRGGLPAAEAGWIAASLARAVAELHAAGVIHGGISLDTMLRDPRSGAVRLLQYPLVGDPHDVTARLPLERAESVQKLGTGAAFIAPECILGGGVQGPPADVYAVGCVLAALLTARLPCWKGDAAATLAEAATNGFTPPGPPKVPMEVGTLIGYLTARDPSARYSSVNDAADAIATCFGFPTTAAAAAAAVPVVPSAGSTAPASAPPGFDRLAVEAVAEAASPTIVTAATGLNEATRRARRRMAILRGVLVGVAALALVGVVLYAGSGTQTVPKKDHGRPHEHEAADTPVHPAGPPEAEPAPEPTPKAEMAVQPKAETAHATEATETVVLVEDPNVVWDSPTHGPRADLSFLPPGSQAMLVARLGELTASEEGGRFLEAFGPSVREAIAAAGKFCGCDAAGIVRLLAGWQADAKGNALAGYAFDLAQPLSIDDQRPPAAWGGVKAEQGPRGETVFRGSTLAFWMPKSRGGRTLVVSPPALIDLMVESGGEPPLTTDLARLAERFDDQRHVILFGSPAWFEGDGREILSGPLARLAEPLSTFFGPGIPAAAISVHLGTTGYVELLALPPADTKASKLATSLTATLDALPERIEHYCNALDPHPFGRTIVLRLPSMIRALHSNLRHGVEGKVAILNCHLPASAPHNIVLAGELALEQTPGKVAVAASDSAREPPAEGLQKKVTLVFPKDTLERSMQMLSEEIGIPIEILGKDLQLDGITKNQSFGLEERDATGESVLRTILAKADSGGRLVYVIREKEGGMAIDITTRAAAQKRGDKLPPGFEKPGAEKPK